MCWYRLNALPAVAGVSIISWGAGDGISTRFGISISNATPSKIRCIARCTDTDAISTFVSTNNLLAPGVWQHAAFTLDYVSKTPLLYVNGVNQAVAGVNNLTGVATSNINSTSAKIGCDILNTVFVDGIIEDARLYQRVLSEQEIMTIYTGLGSDGILQSLASRYPLNDLASGQPVSSVANIGPIDRVIGVNVNANPLNFGATIMTPRKRPRAMHSG
jgi:Concanavalin A-like lectin/glucanases superfamily